MLADAFGLKRNDDKLSPRYDHNIEDEFQIENDGLLKILSGQI